MPQRVSRPFQARRALLRYLAPRYQQVGEQLTSSFSILVVG